MSKLLSSSSNCNGRTQHVVELDLTGQIVTTVSMNSASCTSALQIATKRMRNIVILNNTQLFIINTERCGTKQQSVLTTI